MHRIALGLVIALVAASVSSAFAKDRDDDDWEAFEDKVKSSFAAKPRAPSVSPFKAALAIEEDEDHDLFDDDEDDEANLNWNSPFPD